MIKRFITLAHDQDREIQKIDMKFNIEIKDLRSSMFDLTRLIQTQYTKTKQKLVEC
jgi:hypothetical protein